MQKRFRRTVELLEFLENALWSAGFCDAASMEHLRRRRKKDVKRTDLAAPCFCVYSHVPMLPAFTVFDVETTGLDPRQGHRILEIAGVRVEGGKILEEMTFSQLVNPERPIPWEAKRVNHISDEEVLTAPTIDVVLPEFLRFAGNSSLVAHNAEFDMGFLNREKECCWGYVDLPESFCTMKLSQTLFPHEFRHNLDVVSLRLGLTIPVQRHRALPDVLVTAQALLKMLEIGKIQSIDDLRKRAGTRQLARS